MKDVAYLLAGHDDAHVETYFAALREALGGATAVPVEAEWRGLYRTAQRDLQRFFAGWRG